MSTKINPPYYNKEKGYERYKQELRAWQLVTDIKEEKRGIVVALSLPESDDSGIRERVFDEITLADLNKKEGLDKLIEYMDKKLGKDDLADCLEKFEDFEDFKRESTQSMTEFISKFDQKYNRISKLNMTLPPAILAFMLLKKAGITKSEKMLVLTGMDYSEKEELYEQAKKSLLKFKGEQGGGCGNASGGATAAIKLEPAFLAENEEALWNAGYFKRNFSRGNRGTGRGYWQREQTNRGRGYQHQSGGRGYANRGKTGHERHVNPQGPDGRSLLCISCGSFRHLIADCPDSWENMSARANIVEESGEDVLFTMMQTENAEHLEDVLLLTGLDKDTVKRFGEEARKCAVLDSACSSTVCGAKWMDDYLQSLKHDERDKVVSYPSSKTFKFGGGERLKSSGCFDIPATVVGKEVTIRTDVVESDIPLLLSKDSMKKAGVKLDLQNDTAEIYGVQVTLNETSSGHYCIPIDKDEDITVETVCAVNIERLDAQGRYRTLMKLHRQFAHPPEKRFKGLLEDAGAWHDDFQPIIDKIYETCEVCRLYKKTPPRPVVAMPMASRFNQKVCMDLKKWRDRYILHLIDMWSRFSVSVFIERKRPSEVIDKIMTCWIGAAFGVMEAIVSDNGGEFCSAEMREVCSILHVEKITTAAESPFQNGLCERNHAVVDNMLLKMEEQCPDTPVEVLLSWANMAKNSLQMWHGFSSYQLVFGKNPNLPNIMTDQPPALEGLSSSEILVQHLNGLHAARRAFIESESDERVRRALRGKVRAAERIYSPGDQVYYKRESHDRWLGPARVVFQDGKVVFLRHGSTFVRVSPNRLVDIQVDVDGIHEESTEQADEKTRGNEFASKGDVKHRAEETLGDQQPSEDVTPQAPSVSAIDLRANDMIRFKVKESDGWIEATVMSRGGKMTGNHKNWFNIKDSDGFKTGVNLDKVECWEKLEVEETNIVLIPKVRHVEEKCIEAKQVELSKLKDFGTYEEVPDTGQFRISTTWVLWEKGSEIRARLVARGYEDEQCYPKDSPTIGKSAMRMVLAITASKGWEIKTTDIKSAFLQGKEMDREVYLKPPAEAKTKEGFIWRLRHCLYGLNDAARQFYQSVVELLKSVGCKQSSLDPALFFMLDKGELIGVVASHVDDFLHSGTPMFEKIVLDKLRDRFLAGKVEGTAFRYVGFDVLQDRNGIVMDHSKYMAKLDNGVIDPSRAINKNDILSVQEQTQFRQLVGRINWAVQGSRPDLAFDMIELSTRLKQGTVADLIRAVKCIGKLKSGISMVKFTPLGMYQEWRLVVYTDAAFANLNGVGSIGAYVIFLMNSDGNACTISWSSSKIKRVVRSTLSAEMLSLQEGIDNAIYIRGMIAEILNKPPHSLSITAYVDNKSVTQALCSTKLVDDKRLRVDIASIQQNISDHEISGVRWIQGEDQLADCMTKRGASAYKLLQILKSGHMQF